MRCVQNDLSGQSLITMATELVWLERNRTTSHNMMQEPEMENIGPCFTQPVGVWVCVGIHV